MLDVSILEVYRNKGITCEVLGSEAGQPTLVESMKMKMEMESRTKTLKSVYMYVRGRNPMMMTRFKLS